MSSLIPTMPVNELINGAMYLSRHVVSVTAFLPLRMAGTKKGGALLIQEDPTRNAAAAAAGTDLPAGGGAMC